MDVLESFPYDEIRFGKSGEVLEPADVEQLLATLREQSGLTDLLVLSHGWNNHMEEARRLYGKLAAQLRAEVAAAPDLEGRRFAIAGVLWPSKRFADRDLIPGGAASAVAATLDTGILREQLELLQEALGGQPAEDGSPAAEVAELARLEELLPLLETSPAARRELADRVRAVLPRDSAGQEDASDDFFTTEPEDLLDRLGAPVVLVPAPSGAGGAAVQGVGGAAATQTGGALGLGDALTGARAAASRLLNYATYYVMKDRAGRVGRAGLAPVLERVREGHPDLRLHLAGHSFGGRVVTAAADAAKLTPPVASLTLLQAAFSHNGFAVAEGRREEGAFRAVLTRGKVAGPVVVTHTSNDRAVGLAYPLASRIARQDSSALGDRDDPYGGLGRNGAVCTPEAVDEMLLAADGAYHLRPGTVHNLRSDHYIADHGAVTGREVAHALLAAMTTG